MVIVLSGKLVLLSLSRYMVTISVPRTLDAVPLLEACKHYIDSFEVQTGTMDDVFIAITGKEIRA